MSLNPIDIIAGGVRGALEEALPGALRPVLDRVANAAHRTPASAPLPAEARRPQIDVDAIARAVEARLKANPAVEQVREAAQPIAWWQSPVMVGSIVGLFAPLLGLLGYSLSPTDHAAVTQIVIGLFGALGSAWALISRLRSKAQPVTATRREIASG